MANKMLSATVETTGLLAALDRIPAAIVAKTLPVARATAGRIQAEARVRVRRATGKTAAGIIVRELAGEHAGFEVAATRHPFASLPGWIEFGTKHMPAVPFLFPAAAIEQGPNERAMIQAITEAIDEAGFAG